MDNTIALVEKKIAKLGRKLIIVNRDARYCFDNDYPKRYALCNEKRKQLKNLILSYNQELDILYKRFKKK
jgi:cellulose synthase/poly-beta-1,6-N-acetylglucosamine synthase-like glycosyltransferase|tara:strand:- start:1585 stop:1794 length:210 start_codon:yes stop_codon:yes gene_type:complete